MPSLTIPALQLSSLEEIKVGSNPNLEDKWEALDGFFLLAEKTNGKHFFLNKAGYLSLVKSGESYQ
jgi:hypothetical protein